MGAMTQQPLTKKYILLFWMPLAATWLMMSVEGPFLAAIIARLADPKYNLAAYGVAFSFALIIEAPIIMIMSAATALVRDADSYRKLKRFTYTLNAAITALMLLFIIPPVFYFIAEDVIRLPPEVARLTHYATAILLPWPGAIGYRRFYQGILIRNNLTRRVAYGTIIRLLSMSSTGFLLYHFSDIPGALAGAAALSVGVTLEAAASKVMAWQSVKRICSATEISAGEPLTYRFIINFYYPLALTSMLGLGVHPLVTFFMGQSRMALESLAVLPVVNSLVFIFRSMGLSYQEVGIALLGDRNENLKEIRNFAAILGSAAVAVLTLLVFTPLSNWWFETVSGLGSELSRFAELPAQIMAVMPGLSVLLSYQRAFLVNNRYTRPVTHATAIEVAGIIMILFISIHFLNMIGAVAATIAFVLGRLGANVFLFRPYFKLSGTPPEKVETGSASGG
ncbi:MAG: hypothetical protein WAN36_10500 [Calditrichia bacterium]